ncbi:hypothetical protein EV360DRAFT_81064 [Lentinula raphanica]|nr:hypothetical protein EV360DRAFT_81064 [Lentinula raphanica]
MVSPLWIASSEGRLEQVQELLGTASSADVNIKDQNGVTPLIEAVKNGHVEVIHALLAHGTQFFQLAFIPTHPILGADPLCVSIQGPPQSYTQDPTILEILNSAQAKLTSSAPPNENGFYPEPNGAAYAPHPAPYTYYPPYNTSPPEGAAYYPPLPPQSLADTQSMTAPGPGNLPPPEIARMIPCRYFPACRYGASCLFAHPQGPYMTGPPSAQYPAPYEPMNANYPPNDYYPMSAPPFQSPPLTNGMTPIISSPNGAPPAELVPPPQPFSPNGAPPAAYAAMSPVGEPAPYLPQPPMSAAPLPPQVYQPLPPPQQQQLPMPSSMYNNNSMPPPPFVVQPNGVPQYPPMPVSAPVAYTDGVIHSPPLNPQSDNFTHTGHVTSHREPTGHTRRGSIRRGSFTSRRPPCLFFPSGSCKNGADCRFPHIQPNEFSSHSYTNGRGGAPKAHRGGHLNHNVSTNGLDAKMASLTIQNTRSQNGHSENPIKTERKDGTRSRLGPGSKHTSKRPPPPPIQQRVPNADEFPTLGNLTSPPPKSSGFLPNGHGPTAAQVLQAPAPRRDSFPLVNGTHTTSSESGSVKDSESSVVPQSSTTSIPTKVPITFATIAAAAAAPAEVAAEVSVSA